MSRCAISSSAVVVSTDVRSGLLAALGEVVRTAVLVQLQKLIPPSDASVAQAQSLCGFPPSKVQPFGGTSTEMDNHKTPAHFDPRRGRSLAAKIEKRNFVNMPGGQLHSEKENRKC